MYAKECLYIQDIFKQNWFRNSPQLCHVKSSGSLFPRVTPEPDTYTRTRTLGRKASPCHPTRWSRGWFFVVIPSRTGPSRHKKHIIEQKLPWNFSIQKKTPVEKTHLQKNPAHFSLLPCFFGEFFQAFLCLSLISKPVRFQGRMKWEMRVLFRAIISDPRNGCQIIIDKLLASFGGSKIAFFLFLSFFFTETHWHRNQGALYL